MRVVQLIYRDALGEVRGELETDGRRLTAVLDGHRFAGWLDSLEPLEPSTLPPRFVLAAGGLSSCALFFILPITVRAGERDLPASIGVELELGAPRPDQGLDRERVVLELVVDERRVRSSGRSGWFEDELVELQRACPDLQLAICFGCGLSDYSPYGHGLFGNLMCFRGNKVAYRAVQSKQDLFAIIDTVTEQVQETHVCTEYEPRAPGTGYRGS
jgi:hypothetical protein